MMIIRTFILSLILMTGLSSQVDAQKFGHLNSGNLLSELPETATAEKELEAYQKVLAREIEQLQIALDNKVQTFSKNAENIPPKTAQEQYLKLQKEQEDIMKKGQENQGKLLQKRDDLMKPLFDKVQKAIDEVGKENGYTFIFDTSTYNAILFVEESDDIAPLVKAKLGL